MQGIINFLSVSYIDEYNPSIAEIDAELIQGILDK